MIGVAHRGLAGLYPENTLLSFSKALEYKPDMMELDVQLTKDNVAVVFHDEELKRTTGVSGWIKDFTYRELSQLTANNGFKCECQKIPTLDEYFDLISGVPIKTFVELKNSFITYPGLEEETFKIIQKHNRVEDCIIYSANHYSVMKYKKQVCPESDICFPFDNWIFDYGEYCEKRNVTKTIPYYKAMSKEMIDDFHQHGVTVFPWTVDDPEEMKMMEEMGADGLLTNRIDLFEKRKREQSLL